MPGTETAPASGEAEDQNGRLLYRLAALLAAAGLALAAWPLIDSMNPSAEAVSPVVSVDLNQISPGEWKTIYWRQSIPVFIVHRTAEQISLARADDLAEMPYPQADRERVQRDQWLVVIPQCRFGYSPRRHRLGNDSEAWDSWYCGYGDVYDLSGRLRTNWGEGNFPVPPYYFQDDRWLVVGEAP